MLDELCEAKQLTSCVGLVECDILPISQKRVLLAGRATRMRAEEGITPLSGVPHERRTVFESLRQELLEKRQRLVRNNRDIESEMTSLGEVVGHGEITDEVERARASESIRFDDVLERLRVRELDSIDRALDAIAMGTYGVCSSCGHRIEIKRLRLVPDTNACVPCAREPARTP
jgi:RNA polymerase-binding transcription factor DksA